MRAATALLALVFAAPAGAATTLCWRATGLMWDPAQGRAVPTSEEELARLGRAFASWEKASGGALSLRQEPPDADSRDGTAGIPRDGCVHAVLHGERNFHGELAHGGYDGTIPGGYERGYFFVSRKPDAARFETLVHEIGHALGLPHSAVPESVMFSGPRRPGSALVSEQDALDLRARWGGEAYALSGTIVTGRRHPYAAVFAVSEDGGRSYSARSDHMGRFRVAVGGAGGYRLVARPVAVARDLNDDALGGMRESWFVSDGISDADRSRAMVLSLSGDQREVKELRLRTLDLVEAAPPRAPAPGAAEDEPDAPALEPAPRSGPPPVVQLPFDRGYDDEGPHRLKGKPEGNEIRLAAGRGGRALFIGGTEDWLDYPLPAPLQFPRGFSLELWLKREDWENPYRGGSGWQTVASLATGASLSITAPGCPLHKPWALEGFVSRHSGGREHARAHSKGWSVPAGRWVHAALVYDPAERALIVYLDGREADRALGAPEPELNIRQIRLGTWYKANQAYRGLIDEVEIYDYPRSAADIAAAAGR